jgi:hypothetical protein
MVAIMCIAMAAAAHGSVKVAGNAKSPTLRVSHKGVAEIGWTTTAGTRRHALVYRDGTIRWSQRIATRDVSSPSRSNRLPLAVAVRQTPDGRLWALQSWRRLRGGPMELRFSRWRCAPTRLTLNATCCKWKGENIAGRASFHGKPVHGFSATPEGVPLDKFGRNVYLDTRRGGQWRRMLGILARRPHGRFNLWIRPPPWHGTQYRATISGPNRGWALGPDAHAWTRNSRS